MSVEQTCKVETREPSTATKTAQIEGAEYSRNQVIFKPTLNFYHQNARGTGCALKIELHPAQGSTPGSMMFVIAGQRSLAKLQGEGARQATFDWPAAIIFKLDFGELAKILAVLRGRSEDVNDGKGLLHKSAKAVTYIHFRHTTRVSEGYLLDAYRVRSETDKVRFSFLFSVEEALGLESALAASMGLVAFGVRSF